MSTVNASIYAQNLMGVQKKTCFKFVEMNLMKLGRNFIRYLNNKLFVNLYQ